MQYIKSCTDYLKESIWSDLQDRASGEVERKEDDTPEYRLSKTIENIKNTIKADGLNKYLSFVSMDYASHVEYTAYFENELELDEEEMDNLPVGTFEFLDCVMTLEDDTFYAFIPCAMYVMDAESVPDIPSIFIYLSITDPPAGANPDDYDYDPETTSITSCYMKYYMYDDNWEIEFGDIRNSIQDDYFKKIIASITKAINPSTKYTPKWFGI